MSGSIQNKLQQLEIAPPPAVWEKISATLDEELIQEDITVSARLENIEIVPPAGTWNKIEAALNTNIIPVERKPPGIIPLLYRRIAVAALITGVMAVAAMYFFNRNNKNTFRNSETEEVVKTDPNNQNPPAVTQEQKELKLKQSDSDQTQQPIIASVLTPSPKSKKQNSFRNSQQAAALQYAENDQYSNIDYSPAPEEAPLYELHTVSALQPVSVSAPPLRDKKGNIILDLAMISNPDDPYITVTGPNGKQTKISNKFISCLSYINASLSSSDMDSKAIRCKTQFEEWRTKLLSEAAFIPTANNFFDIFELKDLLED